MGMKSVVYNSLPKSLKPIAKRTFYFLSTEQSAENMHKEFVEEIFESGEQYEEYTREFDNSAIHRRKGEAIEKYREMTGKEKMGAIPLNTARDFYAVIRAKGPSIVVETGVCNGLSTYAILLALDVNDHGKLYSIDYPHYADEALEDFREETFQQYGGAAIPKDKEPGWIIPEKLKGRWELSIGKSQAVLPKIITELGEVDVFIHDSEHSHPCMMFEYELAYEWLNTGGIILSDDIDWNDAFAKFVEVRNPPSGRLSKGVGYLIKD